MTLTALVPLAPGCEEMEAVIIIDVLRRAGFNVTAAGLQPGPVIASRHVRLLPDTTWDHLDPSTYHWIILPGGNDGTQALLDDPRIIPALQQHHRAGKPLAAVCAAPLVLAAAGILTNDTFTCHPAARDRLGALRPSDQRVVVHHHLITSQGPGTTFEFALAIVAHALGQPAAHALAHAMLYPLVNLE
ncbi:MAG TPA: DJ-1/PfpI family protein [Kiritimatiellia bacterium]|nr:DJ-1/PfpI family protein [Kiritimatiellia bacterium]